ncbi:uncharacterized protein LOC144651967 isoform X1 [Oculina patagonica]
MSSHKGQGRELSKMKKPGNGPKDLGATLEPSKEGIQDTARAKSQSSNSQGATGPSGSRPDSKDGDTMKQKTLIVKATNFVQGHWYKCPNKHIFAISGYGGAIEPTCPECGARIGGTHRTLAQGY